MIKIQIINGQDEFPRAEIGPVTKKESKALVKNLKANGYSYKIIPV